MDIWIERFKVAKPLDPMHPVIIPGEPEYAAHQDRLVSGIPLNNRVVEDLTQLAIHLNLDHPF
jgi:LDH2 family malate/lactate/ureidoglycolate dehydrogenase